MNYLSLLIMIAVIFLAGIAVQKLLKIPFAFTNAIMVGFLSLMAVFHVIAYPMMRLNTSFSLLFWVYSGVLLLTVLFAATIVFRREFLLTIRSHTVEIWQSIRRELPLLFLMLGMALFSFLITYSFARTNSDDSYYLPRVMEIITQNQVGVSHGFCWTGLEETSFPETVDASTLECWKAYWSYLFNIQPTVFCRTNLTFIVQFVSCCCLYQAFVCVSRQAKPIISGCVFLLFYLLFITLDNSVYGGIPFWTISFPTQGKAVLLSIIYPSLIYGCARIVELGKGHIPWTRWCMLSVVLTAGIASTIVGVFWTFIGCVSMGLPYLIIERRKDIIKLIPPLILTSLPVIIYSGLALLGVAAKQTLYLSIESLDWIISMKLGLNVARLDLFIFCLAFICLRGSKMAKYILVGGTVTLAVSFLNPLLFPVVSKYITSGSVYYRLFWIVPIYFSIAYTAAETLGACSVKTRQMLTGLAYVSLLACVGIGLMKASPMELCTTVNNELLLVTDTERRTNPRAMEHDLNDLAETILDGTDPEERVRVMWISVLNCNLRQYSNQIELVGACRSEQWEYADQPLGDCDISPLEIHDVFVRDNLDDFDDPDWAHTQLVLSGIDYFCVDSSSEFAYRASVPAGFEFISDFGGISLYRVIR